MRQELAVRPVGRAESDDLGDARRRARPEVRGKFLWAGAEKLFVRGVTYGTFRPGDGHDYPEPDVVEADFRAMAEIGANAVRTYTVPPRWLLDAAVRHGLYVLVGLPWEQHIAFLDDRGRDEAILDSVREGVERCAGHPALLGFAVGNEIPAPIVRWHGRKRTESFIRRLYDTVKDVDPGALVTYVNFPSTEYLQLPFLDFVSFNVYLESPEQLTSYLARLQNVAGDRPLVMGEIGLDSRRNGEEQQARVLDWQVRATFAAGCAGAFVYAWTDEWYRGGHEIEDWDFGLTRRDRSEKPALAAVHGAFADVPLALDPSWLRASVIVCTHNGARTLADTLAGLRELDYPDYEVIVVDDGSTDASAAIAAEYGVRVISTPNMGLSSARNTGLAAATGEIVAYVDDDARPDPHWLMYLLHTFRSTSHAAVGGPNLPPPDGPIADAVANAPGGPIHVLLSDELAEHIPGCNMAFRRWALEAIGGFDPQFRAAGDDVDVCWRIQERGWTIAFNPAALVWHHRRDSVRGYLRQQLGYGKAEALLERKWPEKYNAAGHPTWAGRLYGPGTPRPLGRRWRIYYGMWGTGLFQRLYQPRPSTIASLPLMPEWSLVVGALALLTLGGLLWSPLLVALPLFASAVGLSLIVAAASAFRAEFPSGVRSRRGRAKRRALIAVLYLLQPVARLRGRLDHGLSPWRRRGEAPLTLARPRELTIWSEHWASLEDRLGILEEGLRGDGVAVESGADFDRWDIEVRGGVLGAARLRMAIEEHGGGRQLVRFRAWPRLSVGAAVFCAAFAAAALGALATAEYMPAAVFGAFAALVLARAAYESGVATGALLRALHRQEALAEHDMEADLRRGVRAGRDGVAVPADRR